jgi:hypothetical protein
MVGLVTAPFIIIGMNVSELFYSLGLLKTAYLTGVSHYTLCLFGSRSSFYSITKYVSVKIKLLITASVSAGVPMSFSIALPL